MSLHVVDNKIIYYIAKKLCSFKFDPLLAIGILEVINFNSKEEGFDS